MTSRSSSLAGTIARSPWFENADLVAVPTVDIISLLASHYEMNAGAHAEKARVMAEVALNAAITMWRRNQGPLTDEDKRLLEAFK